ncbi:CU044_5270 family protein [Kibdelosporangium philippinense]|uniref:CU044_5270 family protein n=1 Tax=Kibdelosporangium philippinense TaxID=211113 RepID=A0ABS8Z0N5_9PSEU|nr:CU044_5270 family protein [Kibdelosporangium philippinense]MCE7001523.1 CU044_5270 family protein [Kibdelosporangium philippinense]
MDELQLIRELGDEIPLATAEELAPARARLLAARRPRRAKRYTVYGGAVIGMAAAIFAAFTLITPEENNTATADPIQVLRNASAAALQAYDITPAPNQYLYTKVQEPDGAREMWASIDGTHDGLILMPDPMLIPGCRDGRKAVVKGKEPLPGETEKCVPDPAYRPDLPKDVDGMVGYLKANNGDSINSIGKDISWLLQSTVMAPESRAALFGAVSKIPGLRAVTGVKDAVGRRGIQIEWKTDVHSGSFIVDAKSYQYLGYRTAVALVNYAIVDKVGQRP